MIPPIAFNAPAHPGRATVPRRLAEPGRAANSFWVDLSDEPELFAACRSAAMAFRRQAIVIRLAGLDLSRAALHVIEEGDAGRMVRYGAPIRFDAPCTLIAAHMTVGWDGDTPLPHAHGYVSTSDGRVIGGHLAPGLCWFGWRGGPIEAHMTVLAGCALVPVADEETGFRLLSPQAQEVQ